MQQKTSPVEHLYNIDLEIRGCAYYKILRYTDNIL